MIMPLMIFIQEKPAKCLLYMNKIRTPVFFNNGQSERVYDPKRSSER